MTKMMTVGELKAHFSSALEEIQRGNSIIIGYGRARKKLGMIIPYPKHRSKKQRKIGLLEGKASCRFTKDFKLSDEEFLAS